MDGWAWKAEGEPVTLQEKRQWIPLYKYEKAFGKLEYDLTDLRTEDRTCKWCLGPLKNNRQKSFCCKECSKAWQSHYVFNRNRPPVPWRILCRDHFACRHCGWASREVNEHGIEHYSPKGLEVHHIHHVAHGGNDHESNLITLCVNCHKDEHRGGLA